MHAPSALTPFVAVYAGHTMGSSLFVQLLEVWRGSLQRAEIGQVDRDMGAHAGAAATPCHAWPAISSKYTPAFQLAGSLVFSNGLFLQSRDLSLAACSAAEQVFRCPTEWCRREATPLDSFKLIKADGQFHCDVCDAVMEAELGGGSLGGQGEHAQRRAAAQKLLVSARGNSVTHAQVGRSVSCCLNIVLRSSVEA